MYNSCISVLDLDIQFLGGSLRTSQKLTQCYSCTALETSDLLLVIARLFLLLFVSCYLVIHFVYVCHTAWCTNTSHHVAVATKFCINGPSAWNLPHVIILVPRIIRWLPDLWKILHLCHRDLKFSIKRPWGKEVKIWSNSFVTIKVLICSSNSILHSDIHNLRTNIDGGCPPCCYQQQILCYTLFSW